MLLIILLVTTLTLSADAAERPILLQSPEVHSVMEGDSVRFQCKLENANVSKLIVTWYKNRSSKQELITYDAQGHVYRHPGVTARFQPSRDISNNSYILTITNVEASDNAVYVCSVRGSSYGAGTQLNITVPAVGMNRELWIVWISVGAALGATLIAGAALLFCIRCTRSGKQSSSSPVCPADNLPAPDNEPVSFSGDTQVPQKAKKLIKTQPDTCNSPNDGNIFISSQNPTYHSIEAKSYSNSQMQGTETVPGECRNHRELKKQQRKFAKHNPQGQSAPKSRRKSTLRRFLAFENQTPGMSNQITLTPTDEGIYANRSQISHTLHKKVPQKAKKLKKTQPDTCNSPNDGNTFISSQNPTYHRIEAKSYSNSQMQGTETVPGECRNHRELKKQQRKIAKHNPQGQLAPKSRRQSTLRRFLAFENQTPGMSNQSTLTPTDEGIYANRSQISHTLHKKESSDLQTDSNSTYVNLDPRH
ncbi:uncharacterized protein LOC125454654 [Stegostoma tigrinum]|uniref:uncharacterized protein LOC125454654 n=1 Tax=Stegostoma tigrinum TaxID=3053191 RepID=UPI00202B2741|nr:uncharacterized protein LOC125454654 [Stegostoma tigrinum]